jgi:transmembrane sensor
MMNEERVEVELKKMWDDSYPMHSNDIKMASWEKFQSEKFSLQKQKRKTLLFWLTFIIKIFTNLGIIILIYSAYY